MSSDYVLHDVSDGASEASGGRARGGVVNDGAPPIVARGRWLRALLLALGLLSGAALLPRGGRGGRAGAAWAAFMATAGAATIVGYTYISLPIFIRAPSSPAASTALVCYATFRLAAFGGYVAVVSATRAAVGTVGDSLCARPRGAPLVLLYILGGLAALLGLGPLTPSYLTEPYYLYLLEFFIFAPVFCNSGAACALLAGLAEEVDGLLARVRGAPGAAPRPELGALTEDVLSTLRAVTGVQRRAEAMVAGMLAVVFALVALALMDVFEAEDSGNAGFYAGILARAGAIAGPPLYAGARLSARLDAVLEGMYDLPRACVADPQFAPLLLTLVGRCTQGHLSFRVVGVSVTFAAIGKALAALAGVTVSAVVLASRLAAAGPS